MDQKQSQETTTVSSQIPKAIGYENDQDLLDEINYRYTFINKNVIYLKKLPKKLTRTSLKDMIPEMITCRFPEKSEKGNKSYAFIQFLNEAAVDKYLEILNDKVIYGKKLVATKMDKVNSFNNIENFDLTKLYFNGLSPQTKYGEIKKHFKDARIYFPLGSDKLPVGSVTLTFQTKEEALAAFVENNLTLHGIKCHLNFVITNRRELINNKKYSFENPEDILCEVKARFEAQSNRTVVVKNLPASFSLSDLKQLMPTMRNCKINTDKKMGFIDFADADLAKEAVTKLSGKAIGNQKIRAFVTKEAFQCSCLTSFDLNKLHLTNLASNVTELDIRSKFPNCDIELNLNTDNTCIGTATLTFASPEEALENFSKENLQINNVSVGINYHFINKSSSESAANKKRPLEKSDDESEQEIAAKKTKSAEGKAPQRKSMIAKAIPKQVVAKQKVAPKVEADKKKPVIATKEKVVAKTDKAAPATVKVEKPAVKAAPKPTANGKKPEVDRVSRSSVKATEPVSKPKTNIKEKKPEPAKKVVPAVAAGKRKFDQVDNDISSAETTNKKSRVIAKIANKNEKPSITRKK